MRLCHSRMLFVRLYPRETQEMVFDAHDRAFAFFKATRSTSIPAASAWSKHGLGDHGERHCAEPLVAGELDVFVSLAFAIVARYALRRAAPAMQPVSAATSSAIAFGKGSLSTTSLITHAAAGA